MSESVRLAEAAAALEDHFGVHLEASYDEGLRRMTDAVHKQLGISVTESRTLIEELEQARTIRWHPSRRGATAIAGVFPNTTSSGGIGQGAVPVGEPASYWQLGAAGD
jgi:hypothetical protein